MAKCNACTISSSTHAILITFGGGSLIIFGGASSPNLIFRGASSTHPNVVIFRGASR